jgi:hypothetical protein
MADKFRQSDGCKLMLIEIAEALNRIAQQLSDYALHLEEQAKGCADREDRKR